MVERVRARACVCLSVYLSVSLSLCLSLCKYILAFVAKLWLDEPNDRRVESKRRKTARYLLSNERVSVSGSGEREEAAFPSRPSPPPTPPPPPLPSTANFPSLSILPLP